MICFVISGSVLKQQAGFMYPIRFQLDDDRYIFSSDGIFKNWIMLVFFCGKTKNNLSPIVLNGKSQARTLVHSGSKCANACRCNVCTHVYTHVCVAAAEYEKSRMLTTSESCNKIVLTIHDTKREFSEAIRTVTTALGLLLLWGEPASRVTRLRYQPSLVASSLWVSWSGDSADASGWFLKSSVRALSHQKVLSVQMGV